MHQRNGKMYTQKKALQNTAHNYYYHEKARSTSTEPPIKYENPNRNTFMKWEKKEREKKKSDGKSGDRCHIMCSRIVRRYTEFLFLHWYEGEEDDDDRGRDEVKMRRTKQKKNRSGNYWQLALGCAFSKRFICQYVNAKCKLCSFGNNCVKPPPIVSSFDSCSSDASRRKQINEERKKKFTCTLQQ